MFSLVRLEKLWPAPIPLGGVTRDGAQPGSVNASHVQGRHGHLEPALSPEQDLSSVGRYLHRETEWCFSSKLSWEPDTEVDGAWVVAPGLWGKSTFHFLLPAGAGCK